MNQQQLAEIIESRAQECFKSASKNPQYGDIFHVVGTILQDLAKEIRNPSPARAEKA